MIPNSDQSMAERLFTTAEMYPDICSRMEDFAQIIPQTTEDFKHAE